VTCTSTRTTRAARDVPEDGEALGLLVDQAGHVGGAQIGGDDRREPVEGLSRGVVLVTMTPRELMTDYIARARSGDWETAFGYFADDLLIHIPGRSAHAGEHRGKHVAIAYLRDIRERYGEDGIEVELIDMLVGEERVALLVRERFRLDGETIEIRRANVYRVRQGKIAEVTIFEADQYVVDEVLTRGLSAGAA
jgi:uncharacterized protein